MSYRLPVSEPQVAALERSRWFRAAVLTGACVAGVVAGVVAVADAYGRALFARFTSGRS